MRIKDGERLILLGDEEEGLALVKADLFQERIKATTNLCPQNRKGYILKEGLYIGGL